MQRGIATFTLDYGKCPKWLFDKIVKLGREMVRILVDEYGPDEFIRRMADPLWFQSLGTVLAFDWNASGLTTVLTASLKEAIKYQEKDLGIFICGGKGGTSRKTPDQITKWGRLLNFPEENTENLVYNSKMSAKVDSSLVQDDYTLYHHTFLFSKSGAWTVVQQGMNTKKKSARRYHWHSENVEDLVVEPHEGIISDSITRNIKLNMTSKKSGDNKDLSLDLVNSSYKEIMKDITILRKHSSNFSKMIKVGYKGDQYTLAELANREFKHHPVEGENFSKSKYLERILSKVLDKKPKTYEELVAIKGVGPKTIRALALVSEVIYGADASREDPARYSFAHGGKDMTPFPIDRRTYDHTINMLKQAVLRSRINSSEKNKVFKRLSR